MYCYPEWSVRGIAHLGILKAIEESGIKINAIAGRSAGSIADAGYISSKKPHDTKEILHANSYFEVSQFLLNKVTIGNMQGLKKLLQ